MRLPAERDHDRRRQGLPLDGNVFQIRREKHGDGTKPASTFDPECQRHTAASMFERKHRGNQTGRSESDCSLGFLFPTSR